MALATISCSIRECNDFDELHNISITNVESDMEQLICQNVSRRILGNIMTISAKNRETEYRYVGPHANTCDWPVFITSHSQLC